MKQFPPNIDPELFTLTAIVVGLIIEDGYDANELNSIGNWLILVGQITLTTAAQKTTVYARQQNTPGDNGSNPYSTDNLQLQDLINRITILENQINKK